MSWSSALPLAPPPIVATLEPMPKPEPTSVIFIPLLNEGTDVWRPTEGISLGNGVYKVLPRPGHDQLLEDWMFPPGTMVQCAMEILDGKIVLVAKQKVQ